MYHSCAKATARGAVFLVHEIHTPGQRYWLYGIVLVATIVLTPTIRAGLNVKKGRYQPYSTQLFFRILDTHTDKGKIDANVSIECAGETDVMGWCGIEATVHHLRTCPKAGCSCCGWSLRVTVGVGKRKPLCFLVWHAGMQADGVGNAHAVCVLPHFHLYTLAITHDDIIFFLLRRCCNGFRLPAPNSETPPTPRCMELRSVCREACPSGPAASPEARVGHSKRKLSSWR